MYATLRGALFSFFNDEAAAQNVRTSRRIFNEMRHVVVMCFELDILCSDLACCVREAVEGLLTHI